MIVYIIRRLLVAIPILIAASALAFVLVDTANDPVAEFTYQLQMASDGDEVSEDAIENFKKRMYLDRSMPERYWLWLTGIGGNGDIGLLKGEFGPSLEGPVADIGAELGERFFITMRLALAATILSFGLAIISGVISAVRQYHKIDYILTFVGFVALAMPTFWLAALIKESAIAFNKASGATWFYTIRETSPGYDSMPFWEGMLDVIGHLILPTVTLMLVGYASVSRYQRASMLEVLNSDYVRLARAKGVRNRTVMRRHALRTALIPIATFAPLGVAGALSGAIITETIFSWRGLGTYFVESIIDGDSFAVMAFLLISGTLVILANLVSDLLYGLLDPRIRYE